MANTSNLKDNIIAMDDVHLQGTKLLYVYQKDSNDKLLDYVHQSEPVPKTQSSIDAHKYKLPQLKFYDSNTAFEENDKGTEPNAEDMKPKFKPRSKYKN